MPHLFLKVHHFLPITSLIEVGSLFFVPVKRKQFSMCARILDSTSVMKQVASLKKKKVASKKVVSLEEFRELKKNLENKTVLVVDDDEVMRNALKRILEAENYQVMLAEDGVELSKILESNRLDLILLDVNLPWVDGFELCRIIKSHHGLQKIPVIMVSARNTEEDVELGFDAGCDEYITKPFDVDRIMSVISEKILKSS
jgi:CheY-like chemotaxis protein